VSNISPQTNFLYNNNMLPNPYYWAGNEHNLLFPFLFNDANRADRTQFWTRWLLENRYSTGPGGIPGNDDYGTLSAWYTFAAIGFYPVTGDDYYYVSSPAVDEISIMFCGRQLNIKAENNSEENVYVASVTVGGEQLATPFVKHEQLCSGTEPISVVFQMSSTPGFM